VAGDVEEACGVSTTFNTRQEHRFARWLGNIRGDALLSKSLVYGDVMLRRLGRTKLPTRPIKALARGVTSLLRRTRIEVRRNVHDGQLGRTEMTVDRPVAEGGDVGHGGVLCGLIWRCEVSRGGIGMQWE
jgi:hypothetical protein